MTQDEAGATPLASTGVAQQYAAAEGDDTRILIVGAGVAGLCLAQLLRRRGLHPTLVERSQQGHGAGGYMLGLMPFVDPAIAELGVERDYLARSVGMEQYELRGAHGQRVKNYGFDAVTAYGSYRGIERAQLLQTLADGGAAVAYDTTVASVRERSAASTPTMQDAAGSAVDAARAEAVDAPRGADPAESRAEHAADAPHAGAVDVEIREGHTTHNLAFDLVVVTDGLHSHTRELVLDADEIHHYDTGWGGWVVWSDDTTRADTYVETWGSGFFLGFYPVPGRTGVFLGAPHDATAQGPAALAATVRERLRSVDARTERALDAVSTADSPFYWKFDDVQCDRWAVGSTVLLGDAATGFLPTAGVGASMAIESARALAGHIVNASLSGGAARGIHTALQKFERRQRPRVEKAQKNSRSLARLMFREGGALTAGRDAAARFMGVKTALKPTLDLLEARIQ